MSANLFFIMRPHVGTLCCPWRRTPLGEGAGAFFLLLLPLLILLVAPGVGFAQSTLTVVDNEPVDIAPGEPGPGDNMVFSVRRNATYVVALSFATGQDGEVVTHRMDKKGKLEFVGRTPAGPEPRAVAFSFGGDLAVIANSIADELGVFEVGDDGLLREINRVPSDGDNPYDVAVAFNDVVVVANRDSDQINTFHLDRNGTVTPRGSQPTGIDPHVVSVSRQGGLVAVANGGVVINGVPGATSVSLFKINRQGDMSALGDIELGAQARTLAWFKKCLFVGLRTNQIRRLCVNRRNEVTQVGPDTPAGLFLTDLEANEDGLFEATVTDPNNTPTNPLDDQDEVWIYRSKKCGSLELDATASTGESPPSFKQISTFPGRRPIDRHVIVSEFQSGWLRSLLYDYKRR
jgi:hypothetical protein